MKSVARLTDPEILARYKSALANWNVTGYVTWKDIAREWVEENLPGYTTRAVAERMHEFVEQESGKIDQVREKREWIEGDFHYDLRAPIEGRLIYIETILIDDEPDDPTIHVVSVKNA
jgi:hypothetical protein